MDPLYCDRQMGRKGVIPSHATLYSRTECKRPMQIAARSAAPISWETPPPLPRTLCERTVLNTCWSIHKGGSWVSLYETHLWLLTLFSVEVHQEKIWDADGNWQWYFFIFLGLRWPIRTYKKSLEYIVQYCDTLKATWTGRTVLHTRFIKQYWCNLEEIGIMRQFAEKQHTQINCITFGSLQCDHASLIRQIPSFASPCELLVSIFRSLWQRSFT